jgi:hypothetical protein
MDINSFLYYELAKQKQAEMQRQFKFNETYKIENKSRRETFCIQFKEKKICF